LSVAGMAIAQDSTTTQQTTTTTTTTNDSSATPAERRLIRMLVEGEGFRHELAQRIDHDQLHIGLETEKILAALIAASATAEPIQATEVAANLDDRDRRVLFEILFEDPSELTWEQAESCLEALQQRRAERELAEVQRSIEANPVGPDLRTLLERKQQLMKRMAVSRQQSA